MARKRGPKSKADLTPLPSQLPERPRAPSSINAAGKARWSELVTELPVDRLRASDLHMLADMIRNEQAVDKCDALIKKQGQVIEEDVFSKTTGESIGTKLSPHPAVAIRASHLRGIVQMQRALRLCPSARMLHDNGKLKSAGTRRKKPWDA